MALAGVHGGHRQWGAFESALTLALAATGKFATSKVAGYVAAQFAGAFVGAVLVWLAYLPHWAATEDRASKLGVFCTAPGIRHTASNLICEAIGTAVLVFGALAIPRPPT